MHLATFLNLQVSVRTWLVTHVAYAWFCSCSRIQTIFQNWFKVFYWKLIGIIFMPVWNLFHQSEKKFHVFLEKFAGCQIFFEHPLSQTHVKHKERCVQKTKSCFCFYTDPGLCILKLKSIAKRMFNSCQAMLNMHQHILILHIIRGVARQKF